MFQQQGREFDLKKKKKLFGKLLWERKGVLKEIFSCFEWFRKKPDINKIKDFDMLFKCQNHNLEKLPIWMTMYPSFKFLTNPSMMNYSSIMVLF